MSAEKRKALAARIRAKDFFVAPGVYDMISARIADSMGFPGIYMTGYGTVASYLGLADAGLAGYRDMVTRVGHIAGGTTTPLIADADTGYGGLLNIAQTVRGYEAAGACALHIEDQADPKKCGHTPGKQIVSTHDMVMRIKVAIDAKSDPDFLVIARTDSRANEGLDSACKRAEAYAEAGADVLFIEAPTSLEEMEIIARHFDQPLMINITDLGLTPVVPAETLRALGFAFAIYPGAGFAAAAQAIKSVYATLKAEGSTEKLTVPLMPGLEMHTLMGFPDVWSFEEKWGIDVTAEDDPAADMRRQAKAN
ncbi:MAG: isocitrate lyase/PEP mutase family protein [Alphaproteobacteria bacterium]|nr:isocitrate lyase/PEP mutase family protein [Alphaproteobacteria bacterium]